MKISENYICFHYSDIDKWNDIKTGSYKSRNKPGISPLKAMGKEHTGAVQKRAIFSLLEPYPDNWVNNKNIPGLWNHFRGNIGNFLIEIEVDLKSDEAYIADEGYVQSYICDDQTGIPEKYLRKTREEAEHAFVDSMIPFRNYLLEPNMIDYTLPVVVILNHIPITRVRVSNIQPFFLEHMKYDSQYRDQLIFKARKMPELHKWYEDNNIDSIPTGTYINKGILVERIPPSV